MSSRNISRAEDVMGEVDMSAKGKKDSSKNDMSGGDDAVRPKLKAPVALVFGRVPEEDAEG
jgi:hypothetical protein